MQPSADQRARPRAQARQYEHDVVGLRGRALPVLRDGRRVRIVLHEDGAAERAPQALTERQARPVRKSGAQPDGAVGLHDAGAAHADRAQAAAGHARAPKDIGDHGPYPVEAVVRAGGLRNLTRAGCR